VQGNNSFISFFLFFFSRSAILSFPLLFASYAPQVKQGRTYLTLEKSGVLITEGRPGGCAKKQEGKKERKKWKGKKRDGLARPS
jgi:hypothetical protein